MEFTNEAMDGRFRGSRVILIVTESSERRSILTIFPAKPSGNTTRERSSTFRVATVITNTYFSCAASEFQFGRGCNAVETFPVHGNLPLGSLVVPKLKAIGGPTAMAMITDRGCPTNPISHNSHGGNSHYKLI